MVADHIEIETCRESKMSDKPEPLRIDVPAVNRQFRVYPGRSEMQVGTTVKVHVLGKKLKGDVRQNPHQTSDDDARMQVTEYLSTIARFVEFPIVVDEAGQRTVILHPDRPASDAQDFGSNGVDPVARQLSQEYPWELGFPPQDIHLAQQHLQTQTFDLQADLGLSGYEGTLTYVHPVSDKAKIESQYGEEITLSLNSTDESGESAKFRYHPALSRSGLQKQGLAPSCRRNPSFSVCRDGLLVADATLPSRNDHNATSWPIPVLHTNLPQDHSGVLDVARRDLIGADAAWDAPIWHAVLEHLKRTKVPKLLGFSKTALGKNGLPPASSPRQNGLVDPEFVDDSLRDTGVEYEA